MKKIPYKVLQDAWVAGTNALRRKTNRMPTVYGVSRMVLPGDMKIEHEIGVKAAARVILKWAAPTKRTRKN